MVARRQLLVVSLVCAVVGAASLLALFGGCAPQSREERRPMPSASMTHAQALAWAAQHWDAAAFGRTHRTVNATGSMLPLFGSTSVLLTEPALNVQAGDIVIYGERSIVHRVAELRDGHALIAGDNNHASDGWVPVAQIRERVAGILYSKG
jgi:hypothetical protein